MQQGLWQAEKASNSSKTIWLHRHKLLRFRAVTDKVSIFVLDLVSFSVSIGGFMKPSDFFDNMQQKLGQWFEHSPAAEVKQMVQTMVQQGLNKLDLVTREEFDVQSKVLARTRERLEALEAKVTELEAALSMHQSDE